MLTTQQIQEYLDHLTYKPGWIFQCYEGKYEGQHMVIRTEVEDSYNPGQTVTLDIHSMLPPMANFGQLEAWLLWRLARTEVHECREWFKRDGVPIADPHAEGADQDRR